MASSSGDQFRISVGRDAHGPVVAGHRNRVEGRTAVPDCPVPAPAAGEDRPGGPEQTNTAKDHGSTFASQNGPQTVTIHHHHGTPAGDEAPDGQGSAAEGE